MLKDTSKIQHSYIVGPTGSGKSYVAKREAREIRMAGYPVFVASAKAERRNRNGTEKADIREWRTISGAALVTHNPMTLINHWHSGKLPPCCVVFDEGSIDLGNNPDLLVQKMFKLCRDDQIKIILLSQNYKHTATGLRRNCGVLKLFNIAGSELRDVISDFRFDDSSENTMRRATNLKLYEHLHVNKATRTCEFIGKDGKPK